MISTCLPRPGRGQSCPAFRHACPWFSLQEGHCSVHAGGAFPRVPQVLCVVNVKLTMWLARRRYRVVSAHSIAARAFLQGPARHDHRVAANRFGGCAGRGGDARRENTGPVKGRLLRPPFFFSCFFSGAPPARHADLTRCYVSARSWYLTPNPERPLSLNEAKKPRDETCCQGRAQHPSRF